MLKQSIFFTTIKKSNLTVNEYSLLVSLYTNPNLYPPLEHKFFSNERIKPFITDGKLNDKAIRLIEKIDTFFGSLKKNFKIQTVLGDNSDETLEAYLNIFPTQKLPNGKYARGNKKNIQENFMWFFMEYNYDWDTILKATEKYVQEYQRQNYQYMRTAMYFIKKVIDGTSVSELANYCDIVQNNTDYIEERFIKTRVV
jgi:hypothetical protein